MTVAETPAPQRRTEAELERLKRQWCDDACWDIERTEGFEAHHDELLAYRLEKEAEWGAAREREVAATHAIETERLVAEAADRLHDQLPILAAAALQGILASAARVTTSQLPATAPTAAARAAANYAEALLEELTDREEARIRAARA